MGRGQIKPPPGYVLDEKKVTPPAGYVLDAPAQGVRPSGYVEPEVAPYKAGDWTDLLRPKSGKMQSSPGGPTVSRTAPKQTAPSVLDKSLIPLEQLVDATWPDKSYPGFIQIGNTAIPKEIALGAAKVIGRTVEKMSSPKAAGLALGAGVMSEATGTLAIMSMMIKGGFSAMMIKNAYDQFTKEQKPDAPLHERIADKGSGLVDALMAILPLKGEAKTGWANRKMPWPKGGSQAPVVAPVRPANPVVGDPVRTVPPPAAPGMSVPENARPGPVSEAIVSPRTPNVPPRAPYVPENDPNYVKAMADQANDVTAKAEFDRAIANMRTPPTTGLMEDAPVTPRPVGSLGLREPLTTMPEIPDDVKLAGSERELWQRARDQFIQGMHDDFTQGIGELSGKGKVLNTADMNAQATANLTQKDTGFGKMRLKNPETYGNEISEWNAGPGMIAEAIATKGQARFTSGPKAGKSKGLGKLYQDILAASDRQVRSNEQIQSWVKDELAAKTTDLAEARAIRQEANTKSSGKPIKDLDFDPENWKGQEGFSSLVGPRSQKGPFNKDKFQEDLARWKAEEKVHVTKNLELAGKGSAVELTNTKSPQQKLIIHKSTNEPGKWQASQFDEHGPRGHQVFKSKEDALRSYSGERVPGEGPPHGNVGEWLVKRIKSEEGFAAIKDRDLGRKVNPEEFSYGFIGRDGKFYQIRDEHMRGMADAQGKDVRRYRPQEFIKDMAENQTIRIRKTPRTLEAQNFAQVTPEQRASVALLGKDYPANSFVWDSPGEMKLGERARYGYGLSDWLRTMAENEEGFARVKNEKQKGFEFNPVASQAPKSDNPILDMFKGTEEKSQPTQPIMDFRNALAKIQDDTRTASKEDLTNRILQAPESPRISKRELLGLDKKNKTGAKIDPYSLFR